MANVIILENAKWIWKQKEVELFRSLYDRYSHVEVYERIGYIAKDMEQKPDDVLLLYIDQAQKGKLTK
ncbi:hypothetical protein [Jeotgalibaca porci]|uniref:hypothetical protein n=1 Tax=Jeotgalibaca porci TaxID=1868793 RepID=UPI00359F3AAE